MKEPGLVLVGFGVRWYIEWGVGVLFTVVFESVGCGNGFCNLDRS
jgi:hypothetical protein